MNTPTHRPLEPSGGHDRETRHVEDELGTALLLALRAELLKLASHEDDLATMEAVHVPYWAATPVTVVGHRVAARALRNQADQFLSAHLGKSA